MNRKPLFFLRNMMCGMINYIPVISILVAVYAAIFGKEPPMMVLLLMGYGVLSQLMPTYVKRPVGFVAIHFVCLIILFWLTQESLVNRILFGVMAGVTAIVSFVKKAKKEENTESMHIAFVISFLVFSIIVQKAAGRLDCTEWQNRLAVGYVLLLMLKIYVEHYLNYVVMSEKTNANIPEKQIFRNGGSFVLLYSISIVSISALCVNHEMAEAVWKAMKDGFIKVLRFLVSLLPAAEQGEVAEQSTVVMSTGNMGMLFGEVKEAPVWIEYLEKVLFFATGVLIIGGILYGIYYMIRTFLLSFQEKSDQNGDKIESILEIEKRERIGQREKKKSWKDFFPAKTAEEKIRRIYKKTVRSMEKRTGEEKSLSPEFATARHYLRIKSGEARKIEAEALAGIYEKARYSGQNCGEEDIKQARHFAGKVFTK